MCQRGEANYILCLDIKYHQSMTFEQKLPSTLLKSACHVTKLRQDTLHILPYFISQILKGQDSNEYISGNSRTKTSSFHSSIPEPIGLLADAKNKQTNNTPPLKNKTPSKNVLYWTKHHITSTQFCTAVHVQFRYFSRAFGHF